MIRLDKFLCDMAVGSRSEVKELIKKGQVKVNGERIKKPETKIFEDQDEIYVQDQLVEYSAFVYYLFHKPQGVVTATRDNHDKTVLDYFEEARGKDLFPVGRLDKDTEGLLLITNDGKLAHALLSPKKQVEKTYYVETKDEVTKEMEHRLCQGVDIGEDKFTLPAKTKLLSKTSLHLTITEGKFHQVKRMLKAVGTEVTYLKRISMGSLTLDPKLEKGEYRMLTEKELEALKEDTARK